MSLRSPKYDYNEDDDEDYDPEEECELNDDECDFDPITPEEDEILTKILDAIYEENVTQVAEYLKECDEKNIDKAKIINRKLKDHRGEFISTLLCAAFARQHVGISKILLEAGGNPFKSYSSDGPFDIACQSGCLELIDLLINTGNLPLFGNIPGTDGESALVIASRCGTPEIVNYLLDKGAFVNAAQELSKFTALHAAVNESNIEVAKLLINRGANVDVKDSIGSTPLMIASGLSNEEEGIEIADYLIKKNASINKVDNFGLDAFDHANSCRREKIGVFLREKGCKGNSIHCNHINFGSVHFEQYYSRGLGEITRLSLVRVGKKLYAAGGIRSLSVTEAESYLEDGNIDIDSFIPLKGSSTLHSVDLTQVKSEPLVELNRLRFAKTSLDLSTKGPSLKVDGQTIRIDLSDDGTNSLSSKNDDDDDDDDELTTAIMSGKINNSTSIAYYEIVASLVNPEEENPQKPIIAVGFSSTDDWEYEYHVGWLADSIGYHSDDGRIRTYSSQEDSENNSIGFPWSYGDVIGAGYIFEENNFFFTLNGKFLGVSSLEELKSDEVRAIVSLSTPNVDIKFNFGDSPFMFNFHVPTLNWTLEKEFGFEVLSILNSDREDHDNELLVIPLFTSSFSYYNTENKSVETRNVLPGKAKIYEHAENILVLIDHKVILSFPGESCLQMNTENPKVFIYILDLLKNTWTNLMSNSSLAQKKLSKTLQDALVAPISIVDDKGKKVPVLIADDKLYDFNLDTLKLVARDTKGIPPSEDYTAFTFDHEKKLSLVFGFGNNIFCHSYSLLDYEKGKYYSLATSGYLYPSVGKGSYYDPETRKFYFIGGFSSETTVSHIQVGTLNYDYSFGLRKAFEKSNFEHKEDYGSDFIIKTGSLTINCHKAILSARSRFFAELFLEKSSLNEIDLPESQKYIFGLIKFFYSDSMDQTGLNSDDYELFLPIVRKYSPQNEARITQQLLFSYYTHYNSTLSTDLQKILKEGTFSDVTIESSDNARFEAHKALLGSYDISQLSKIDAVSVNVVLNHLYTLGVSDFSPIKTSAQIDAIESLANSWKLFDLANSCRTYRIYFLQMQDNDVPIPV